MNYQLQTQLSDVGRQMSDKGNRASGIEISNLSADKTGFQFPISNFQSEKFKKQNFIKRITQNAKRITIFSLVFYLLSFISSTLALALSWTHPYYNVDISIDENTKYTVTESAEFIFNGELNGVRRDITLHNSEKSSYCVQNPEYTCGGFEFLTFEGLVFNDKKLSESEYKLYEIEDEDTGDRSFRIEKRIHDPEKYVTNETHSWAFTYDIYGGIQWLTNSSGEEVPYFYWNLLPESRGGPTKSSTITIRFPKSVTINEDKFELYGITDFEYTYRVDGVQNALILQIDNLSSFGDVTLSYEFEPDELIKPGIIEYELINPTIGVKTLINGREFQATSEKQFKYFPVGEYAFSIARNGYESFEKQIEVRSNQTVQLNDISLTPTPLMQLLLIFNYALLLIGLVAIPYAIWKVFKKHDMYGKDVQMPKTIIPIYNPPKGVHPYLLGTLKDERVDQHDITGTLIDLAYRGFIKIKEESKNKYVLTKLEGKQGETLNSIEQTLMKDLFGSKTEVKTKDLTYDNFGSKIAKLKKEIYDEMISRDWFKESPEHTRNKYYGIGIGIFIVGDILAISLSIAMSQITGVLSIFTIGVAIAVYGIGILLIATHMPAKTAEGSRVYAEVLGFKMYMTAAERYRVQGLDPEEFVKFLSYAIVFGIEKKWADTFKDIYKVQPDWYEGTTSVWDVWAINRLSRGFVQATEVSMRPVSSSGSSSGGGWSGGGSFGGFSGGGGGGGSSGGW